MTERYKTKKYAMYLLIGAVVLLFLGYTGYEIQKIVFGPRISVSSPENGEAASSSLVTVSGTAQNVSDISLDGRKIYLDENGNFSEQLLLAQGYNVIRIDASDRFGRTTEKVLEVVYK